MKRSRNSLTQKADTEVVINTSEKSDDSAAALRLLCYSLASGGEFSIGVWTKGSSPDESCGDADSVAAFRSLRRFRFSSALRFFSIARARLAKAFWSLAMITTPKLPVVLTDGESGNG